MCFIICELEKSVCVHLPSPFVECGLKYQIVILDGALSNVGLLLDLGKLGTDGTGFLLVCFMAHS